MMAYICNSFGVNQDFTGGMEFRAMISIPVGYLVLFPLSAQRDIASLKYAVMGSIFALTYTSLLFVVECYWYN